MNEFRTRTDGTVYPINGIYTDYTKYDSYTHPMRCKRCGEYVFFYQSENGGKVIFDDLGPPWPKHSHQGDVEKCVALPQDPVWKKSGFEPLIITGKLAPKTGLWEATILGGDGAIAKQRVLWIPKSLRQALYRVLLQKNHPIFCRRIREIWVYEIHLLTEDGVSLTGHEIQGLLIPDEYTAGIRQAKHRALLDKELNHQYSQRRSPDSLLQGLKASGFYDGVKEKKIIKEKSFSKYSARTIKKAIRLFK